MHLFQKRRTYTPDHTLRRESLARKKFVCPKCGLVLNNKGNLTLHLRSPASGYRAAHHIADGFANNGGKRRKGLAEKTQGAQTLNNLTLPRQAPQTGDPKDFLQRSPSLSHHLGVLRRKARKWEFRVLPILMSNLPPGAPSGRYPWAVLGSPPPPPPRGTKLGKKECPSKFQVR
jgi:hypothetical protein